MLAKPALLALLLAASTAGAEPVPVRAREGITRGFLELRDGDGASLARGELSQVPTGDRMTSRTIFRFGDGSLHDETATYAQDSTYRLDGYRLLQKGPRFGGETEVSVDRAARRFSWRRQRTGREAESGSGEIDVPADAVNGILFPVLRSLALGSQARQLSMVLFMPEPKVVRFDVIRETGEPLRLGAQDVPTTRYVLRAALGFPLEVLAAVSGKTPPDIKVWMLGGEAPAFLKFAGPLYVGGPVWRILLDTPPWASRPAP